jgi:hypothetical protein
LHEKKACPGGHALCVIRAAILGSSVAAAAGSSLHPQRPTPEFHQQTHRNLKRRNDLQIRARKIFGKFAVSSALIKRNLESAQDFFSALN